MSLDATITILGEITFGAMTRGGTTLGRYNHLWCAALGNSKMLFCRATYLLFATAQSSKRSRSEKGQPF